jgi:hypothetical protein
MTTLPLVTVIHGEFTLGPLCAGATVRQNPWTPAYL